MVQRAQTLRRHVSRLSLPTFLMLASWLFAADASAVVNLVVASCNTVDRCAFAAGNLNGSVEPGETGETRVVLRNTGTTDATNVEIVVTTTTPGVSFINDRASIATIAARATETLTPDITFQVDPTVPCGTLIRLDIAITSTEQVTSGSCDILIPDPCQLCAPPMQALLRLDSCNLTADRCAFGLGDSNGSIEPGELGMFTITVTNIGSAMAQGVVAEVTTGSPGARVTLGTANLGDIGVGRTVTSTNFNFDLDLTVGCGDDITFNIQLMTPSNGPFLAQCTMSVPDPCQPCSRDPVLSIADCTPTDVCPLGGPGDGNGVVEPGETVTTVIRVENSGAAPATNVVATVNFASIGVNITQNTTSFGNIAPGATATGAATIDYTVDPTLVDCGGAVFIGFTITSDQITVNDACNLPIPDPCILCVPTPNLALGACTHVADTCALGGAGDANGSIDPGEDGELSLSVSNTGTGDASTVIGTVTTATPGVLITQDTVDFGTVAMGATVPGTGIVTYSVDPTVPCGTNIVFDVAFSYDQGATTDSCTIIVPVSCIPCVASVAVTGCRATDSCPFGGAGDVNGFVEPGENVSVLVDLFNSLPDTATAVTATVSTGTPGVNLTLPATLDFGDMPSGTAATSVAPFAFSVDETVPCGTDLVFDFAISSVEGPHSGSCTITIPAPCTVCTDFVPPDLQLQACAPVDACADGGPGDGDGFVDPGETATMMLTLDNVGGDATGISAVVTTTTPGVSITQPNTNFGDIAAGTSGTGLTAITFSVASSVPCGATIDLDVAVTTDTGPFSLPCVVNVPNPCTTCQATTPPGEVPFMITRCVDGAPGLVLEWTAAPGADTYAIYEGTIAGFHDGGSPYDHACSLSGVAALTASVPTAECGDGQDLYYLVVGVNAAGEGPYGHGRPAATTLCP